MAKIVVNLNGGLGNQMFQYAFGRALSIDRSFELVLDNWSGFVRDYQYKRHYELGNLPIQARTANFFERLPVWIYKAYRKLSRSSDVSLINRFLFGAFVNEVKTSYLDELSRLSGDRSYRLLGYWQSPKYFSHHAGLIREELMPPSPISGSIFSELAGIIRKSESVALGVRLYEESENPEAHSRNGSLKTVAEINAAIKRLRMHLPEARFFIFCTHRSPVLDKLELPEDCIFVTHDDGYVGTLDRLWLLTQCKHHLFTNSSYYWWGAWLSAAVYEGEKQYILAADNFINQDGLPEEWYSF